ncbi:hypothetical protein [uncultured Amphritea sp.]|uniref:hypothetical protein n=1 Tax=uncultured Amphritea sp. TaxID=981605 RepID=UPI0026376017|nr:hypothetical protein [uncultured Amphritea sp.]
MSEIKEIEKHAIGNYSILTGVDWLPLEDDTDITARIRSEGLQDARIFKNFLSEGTQKGFCSLKGIKSKKKLVSAAALYAKQQVSERTEDDIAWIVIDSLTDGFWVCMIVNGVILTETGAQLTKAEAEAEALRYSDASSEEGHSTYFAGGALDEFGVPAEKCVNVSLDTILSSLSKQDILLAGPVGKKVGYGKHLLIFLVLIGVAYFYAMVFDINFNFFSKSPEEIQKEQEQQSIIAAENYYRKLQEEPTLQSAMTVVDQLINDSDILDAPWPLQVLNCHVVQGSCIATFVNTNNSSTAPLRAYAVHRCASFDLDPQGFSANCSFRFSPPFKSSERGEGIVEFTEQLLTFSQIGFKTKLMNPISSNIPGATFLPPQYLHREGVWEVSGNYSKLTSVIKDLPLVDWVKVRGVKVQLSDDTTKTTSVVIEGAYVLH